MGIFHKRDVAVKAEKSVTVDDENVEAMEENCIVFHNNTAFSTIGSVLVASPHQSYKKKRLKSSPLNPFRKRTAVGHKRKQPLMEDFGNFLLDDLQLTESEDKDSDSSSENDQENMNKIKSSAHNHHFKGNCISVSRRSKKKVNYSEEISNSSPVSLAIPIENEVNGNSLIMCSLCNTTLRRSRFNHHIKVKHGSTGNSQTVNDKTFSSSKVKVKCELCGRQMLKSSIKKHEREYHIKKNTCQTCGRVFMFKSSLIAHECCVQEDIETDK